MTSKIHNNGFSTELNGDVLDRVSGGTSAMMHAVASAAYKSLLNANAMTDGSFSAGDWQACVKDGYCN